MNDSLDTISSDSSKRSNPTAPRTKVNSILSVALIGQMVIGMVASAFTGFGASTEFLVILPATSISTFMLGIIWFALMYCARKDRHGNWSPIYRLVWWITLVYAMFLTTGLIIAVWWVSERASNVIF